MTIDVKVTITGLVAVEGQYSRIDKTRKSVPIKLTDDDKNITIGETEFELSDLEEAIKFLRKDKKPLTNWRDSASTTPSPITPKPIQRWSDQREGQSQNPTYGTERAFLAGEPKKEKRD